MSKKRAFITGASSGLGAHFASRLAEVGWAVIGLGRRSIEEIPRIPGMDYVQADLSLPETLDSLPARIGDTPDLIVHNAVIYPDQRISVPTIDDLENLFRVNALLPYRLLLDLLSAKPDDRFCSCIVVNSDSIYHARRQSGVYAASKAALRVLTAALADTFRSRNASVSTLLLGPLADPKKVEELRRVAARSGVSEEEITRTFLRRSNTDLVIDTLIEFETCFRSLRYMSDLGPAANGMVCRLDGGSAGSLA